MYEEIDLRPYILALLRNWMWIVGAAVLAGVIAFGLSSLLPPSYEARATVVIVEAREVVQFDPRFESVDESQPLTAYPELATSDELLRRVLAEVEAALPAIETVQGLRGLLSTEAGDHPSVVYLTVRHGDPEVAAEVANAWAASFVTWASDLYGTADGEQLVFFENQLEQARVELEAAEDALVAFQERNRSSILNNRLSSLRDTQSTYLNEQRSIRFLLQDIRDLRGQLAQEPGDGTVSFADQLAALSLQLQAFDAQGQHPLQFQTSADVNLTGRSRQEQINYLDSLIASLEAQMGENDDALDELEPQILAIQAEKEAVDTEGARLQRSRDVADETYVALARKVAEERITSADETGSVRVASRASVPQYDSGPGRLIVTGVGIVVGLAIGIFGVLILGAWRTETLLSEES